MLSPNKEFYEKLSKKKLSEQEVFEARQNIVGFFDTLFQIDKRLEKEKLERNKKDSEICSAGST